MDLRIIANNILLMSIAVHIAGRKEDVLAKYPKFKDEIEYFVSRDPSHSLKYLDWQIKILESKQAPKNEIADITDLFHKFNKQLDEKDINKYTYRDFTKLRDRLFEISGKSKQKKEETKERYDIPSECKFEDISIPDGRFKVLHILNKSASSHYGHGTKWCITMKNKEYFEEYDAGNVVFFFILDKNVDTTLHPGKQNSLYKIAVSVSRDLNNVPTETTYFDAEDESIDESEVEKYVGNEFSSIKSKIEQISKTYPKSKVAEFLSDFDKLDEWDISDKFNKLDEFGQKLVIDKVLEYQVPEIDDRTLTRRERELERDKTQDEYREWIYSGAVSDNVRAEIARRTYDRDLIGKLSGDESEIIRAGVARNHLVPKDVLVKLSEDNSIIVLRAVARNVKTPKDILMKLFNDYSSDIELLRELAHNGSTPTSIMVRLFENEDLDIQKAMAWNSKTPPEILTKIFNNLDKYEDDDASTIKWYLKINKSTPAEILEKLKLDAEANG